MTENIVELKLTYYCNQDCKFCCFKSIEKLHMSHEEIVANLEYIKENTHNVSLFIVCGGEPCIYPKILDYLEYIKKKIKPKEIVIHTNGLFFSKEENVKAIKKFPVKLMISYHTNDQKFYEENISKYEKLEKINKAIINLKNNHINFVINTLILRDNLKHLKDITTFLIENKAQQIEFRIPYSTTESVETKNQIVTDAEEVITKIYEICNDYKSKINIFMHPCLLCVMENMLEDESLNKLKIEREYIKQFIQKPKDKIKSDYHFIDKNNQKENHNINSTQISAVMKNHTEIFHKIKPCETCPMNSICHGIPNEFKDLLKQKPSIETY